MGILLLVTAFNAVMFVGPFLTMLYDVFRWWIFHKKSSGNRFCSNICSTIFDADVNSEAEMEITLNNMENLEKEIKAFNNPSVNITSNDEGTWKTEHAGEYANDLNDAEIVDDYIMKSSSPSFASSNRLDRSLSSTSQDADTTEKDESYSYHV
jgi:hypothetical protein